MGKYQNGIELDHRFAGSKSNVINIIYVCAYIYLSPLSADILCWLYNHLESVEPSVWAGSTPGYFSFVAVISHDPTQGRVTPL